MPVAALSGIVAISAGGAHSLALTSNGTIIGWGRDLTGQINPALSTMKPSSGVVGISGADSHSAAFDSSGKAYSWRDGTSWLTTVPTGALADVVAIATGHAHNVALKKDGSTVAWGDANHGRLTPQTCVSTIDADGRHNLALRYPAITFSPQALASPSTAKPFNIRNIGLGQLNLAQVMITGVNASDFSITTTIPGNTQLAPTTGTLPFGITFTPSALGPRKATLHIRSNDSNEGIINICLIGTGDTTPPPPQDTCGRVVYESNRGQGAELFVQDAASSAPPLQITNSAGSAQHASWSPDGQHIVYVDSPTPAGPDNLIICSPTGTVERIIAATALGKNYAGYPDWSPDGTRIVVTTHNNWADRQLTLVSFNTNTAFNSASYAHQVLVPGGEGAGDADFSPDGHYLYYNLEHTTAGNARRILVGLPGVLGTPIAVGAPQVLSTNGNPILRAYALSVSMDSSKLTYNSELYKNSLPGYQHEEAVFHDLLTGTSTFTPEAGHQYARYAQGGSGEYILGSTTTPTSNGNLFLCAMINGALNRVALNVNDPTDLYSEGGADWFKGNLQPLIAVTGNSQVIADGDTTPTSADHTRIGPAVLCSGTITRTFIITNSGCVPLMLTAPFVSLSGANANAFSVTQPTSPIAAGASVTFQVTYTPTAVGVQTATVTISNNSQTPVFDFAINGQGTNLAPTNITLTDTTPPVGCVYENDIPNAIVGTLGAVDPDAGQTGFTFALQTMVGASDNASFTITGNVTIGYTLKLTPVADYETKNTYTVGIRVTDCGGLTYDKVLTIIICDCNEMPFFTKGTDKSHAVTTTSAQSFPGWATAINDGDSLATQTMYFTVTVQPPTNNIFSVQPTVAPSPAPGTTTPTGNLTYTLNGTSGTATITVTMTDDTSINGCPALTTVAQTFTVTNQGCVNNDPVFIKGPNIFHPVGLNTPQTHPAWAKGIDDGDTPNVQGLTFIVTLCRR